MPICKCVDGVNYCVAGKALIDKKSSVAYTAATGTGPMPMAIALMWP